MVQQGQIDHLLQETGEIPPPSHVARQATLQDYDETYRRSIADPEGFWSGGRNRRWTWGLRGGGRRRWLSSNRSLNPCLNSCFNIESGRRGRRRHHRR